MRTLMLTAVLIPLVAGCSESNKNTLQFTNSPLRTATVGVEYTYAPVVTGSATTVVFQLLKGPAGMSIDSAGRVSWTPTAAQIGFHMASLGAFSMRGRGTLNWNVTVVAAPPQLPDPGLELAFHIPWRDSMESAGEVPAAALRAATVASEETYGFRWTDAQGEPDLASEGFPELNSWRNPETQAAFVAMVRTFAELFRPARIYLGNPVEPPLEPEEREAWNRVLTETRAAAGEVSPETVILTR